MRSSPRTSRNILYQFLFFPTRDGIPDEPGAEIYANGSKDRFSAVRRRPNHRGAPLQNCRLMIDRVPRNTENMAEIGRGGIGMAHHLRRFVQGSALTTKSRG